MVTTTKQSQRKKIVGIYDYKMFAIYVTRKYCFENLDAPIKSK